MFPIMGATNPTGYNLTRSLRFRSSASAYLKRTLTGVSITKLSYSVWTKRGALGSDYTIQGSLNNASNYFYLGFNSSDQLDFLIGGTANRRKTTQVFRDPSAWYHIYLVLDTTQATADNRIKIYVNGAQVTAFATNTTGVAQNANLPALSTTMEHDIGGYNAATAGWFFDGYLAEYYYLEGQALDVTSFGSTNTLTGVWQPARYTGTFTGTNSCYLPFTDNSALTTSSNVGLGKDFSGNGNYWTTNNISITAGVTYDSMTDVPTLTSATAANFCVANPINAPTNSAITNGNLTVDGGASAQYSFAQSTFNLTSGSFYFEATLSTSTTVSNGLGLLLPTISKDITSFATTGVYAITWSNTNQIRTYTNGGSLTTVSTTNWANGDVIQVAYNATNGNIWFGRNGSWYPATSGGTVGDPAANTNPTVVGVSGLTPTAINYGNGTKWDLNFGQRPFTYTPPSGFKALNTYNLPTSTIVKGNTVMDATLWTGNGSTQNIVNAAPFKPDFVWIKIRSAVGSHRLLDSVRGATNALSSNLTNAEFVDSTGLTAFNSNGFTLGADGSYNGSGSTYVGWQWQAGQGTTSTNTNGSITSTVSVNASAGFSVVTYTGTGANATVGHGLGVTPSLIICKARSTTGSWQTYHSSIGNTSAVFLNLDSAAFASSVYWNNTSPTSSVFSIGTSSFVNVASQTQVAYCFAPIAGYSAFGSYTGNGSADGTFVYTGFRPRWIMVKIISGSGGGWIMYDTARKTYNVNDTWLYANDASAENVTPTYDLLDILSNGFKWRSANYLNVSGDTLIYMAFAENPFKNSLAR